MHERQENLRSSRSTSKPLESEASDDDGNPFGEYEEDVYARRPRKHPRPQDRSHHDFRLDIPDFEGQLDPDIFLDWLQTVERIFEFKDIPEDRKVKLVALKLRKYASIWWSNVVTKRVRN